jgi:hypothetical protein
LAARVPVAIVAVFLAQRLTGAEAPPPPPTTPEVGGRFQVAADLGGGFFAHRGRPVPVSASLRIIPLAAVAGGRLRLGATAAVLVENPGLSAAAGPRLSVEVHRMGTSSDLARLYLGAEALAGSGDARLFGGFASVELPEVVAVTAYAGRETRRRSWRIELAIGATLHARRHAVRAGPRLLPLRTVYDAVWVSARTKLIAAMAGDARLRARLSSLLQDWVTFPPADGAAFGRALDAARLTALGSADLGLADIRRAAAASFPGETIDERAFVLTVLQSWRDTLVERGGR